MARRSSGLRRLVGWGAIVGLVGGVVGEFAIGALSSDDVTMLERVALLTPALCFILWWMFTPLAKDVPQADAGSVLDVDERLERIESTFDAAAVPRAGRAQPGGVDSAQRAQLRASIRRSQVNEELGPEFFGLRRSHRGDQATDQRR